MDRKDFKKDGVYNVSFRKRHFGSYCDQKNKKKLSSAAFLVINKLNLIMLIGKTIDYAFWYNIW